MRKVWILTSFVGVLLRYKDPSDLLVEALLHGALLQPRRYLYRIFIHLFHDYIIAVIFFIPALYFIAVFQEIMLLLFDFIDIPLFLHLGEDLVTDGLLFLVCLCQVAMRK